MSKKSEDTQIAPYDPNQFVIDMPENSPALGFDPSQKHFHWKTVYPSNYWNMDEIDKVKKERGGWPVFTPAYIKVQPVFDPMDDEDKRDMSGKMVLYFKEAGPALVLNKSRCQMIEEITGTPNPTHWIEAMGPVALSTGVYNKKAQIVITPMGNSVESNGTGNAAEDANEVLFG